LQREINQGLFVLQAKTLARNTTTTMQRNAS